MIETGVFVFSGIFLLLIKLPRRWLLHLLAYDLAVDVAVSAAVFGLHFGTFSGLMAATIAGLLTSIATTLLKRSFGYIQADRYHAGVFALRV